MRVVLPPPVTPGDRVAVLAPSSPAFAAQLDRGLGVLASWGYEIVEGRHLRTHHGHLAGLDHVRLDDLRQALADPSTRAVFAGRGGYGTQRLVDHVDWQHFRREPTLLVGFSDFTGLLAAAWMRARVTAVHGPFVGQFDRLPETAGSRLRTLLAGGEPEPVAFAPDQVLVGGRASGPLVGGNLSLLCSSIGTPTELDTTGALVFLEDVNEPPYAVDRMLTQLRRSGFLSGVAGVVVGEWRGCVAPDDRPSATVEEVAGERLGDLGVPVVTGLPIGHAVPQLALPYGSIGELDTGAGILRAAPAAR